MAGKPDADLTASAILGGFDGTCSMLGALVFLGVDHPSLLFRVVAAGAISSALSMAGGKWLSDSDDGLASSAVMGAATFAGTILPALPFIFGTGPGPVASCAAVCMLIAVAVAAMRDSRGLGLALAETAGLLAVIFAATLGYAVLFPGGGAG